MRAGRFLLSGVLRLGARTYDCRCFTRSACAYVPQYVPRGSRARVRAATRAAIDNFIEHAEGSWRRGGGSMRVLSVLSHVALYFWTHTTNCRCRSRSLACRCPASIRSVSALGATAAGRCRAAARAPRAARLVAVLPSRSTRCHCCSRTPCPCLTCSDCSAPSSVPHPPSCGAPREV